ncbi:MAG TPA: cytotoxin [Bacilli bacterium]|nr:cytotoxin [Bacilli bacterium]
MRLRFTSRFDRSFVELDELSQKAVSRALALLMRHPRTKSLRMKKVQGTQGVVWEISANMDIRITFEFEKPDWIVVRNCGHHDKALKNP